MKDEKPKNATCKFCGAENSEKYHHIALHKTEDMKYLVKCDNCDAITPRYYTETAAMECWRAGEYTIPTHSERQIYEGCISLMQGLVEDFQEWLEMQEIEVDDESRFCVNKYPTEIVKRLFLWNTRHSGGTSSRAKCRELGIEDCTRSIVFDVKEEEE